MSKNLWPGPTPTPITFDPGVRSKFQIVQGRTYAYSYHVCKFQGSSANSVGGDSGQEGQTDRQTERQTDGGDNHIFPMLFDNNLKQECQTVTRYALSKVLVTMLNAWNAPSDLET